MRRKNRIKTNNSRTIKKSFPRFLSLIIMSLLGVMVFTGLQATSPDMLHTIDNYYDKTNTYDIKVISSMGLVEEDITALKDLKGIKEVEGIYSKDYLLTDKENEYVINISSLPEVINKVEIIDGKLPTKDNEIVFEENFLKDTNHKIGDIITIEDETFKNKEYKIVGTILSPLYFNNTAVNQTRGASTLGTGTVNYYSYILPSNFNQGYYTSIYLTVTNAKKEITSKEEYLNLIENATKKINKIKTTQEDNRFNQIYQGYSELLSSNELPSNLKKPTWYIYDRSDDQTYSSYIDQTISIKNLSAIFPLVFYGVAILVSLISMNRMVEDDRGEIGTLKSLGFSNKEIISKYIRFSLVATLLGGLIGTILGLTAIPYLIFVIYRLLFILPNFHIGLNLGISITSVLISIVCICGASIITAAKVLKEKPATLMRPKPPASGKKILLEKIKILWNHINFSQKITIRNLFRYKKRVFVTIFGITGCTALMLCGFGIKDSIVDITNMQYRETFIYDGIVYTNEYDKESLNKTLTNDLIKDYVYSEQITGTLNESNVTMLVTDNNENLNKIVNTIDTNNKKVSLKDNEVIITDKLADIHEISKGDTITIVDADKNIYELKVSDIVKNYMGHYIYLNSKTLSNYKEFTPNTIYFHTTKELSSKEKDKLSEELLTNEKIINVIHIDTLMDSTSDMLQSLDKIIAVLIILAAALSFVVLYNLSNINITERKREIATLKVLGFYDKEVDNYITKENLILTIVGIAFGLIFGNILTYFVIGTVEMENSRFLREISLNSYIYASVISMIFTIIVNFVTHFSLKKINMIESLKSVE